MPVVFVDDFEERIFQMPINGPDFDSDNRTVHRKLKAFLISTAIYQGKQTEINGINVADPTPSFTDDEWTQLGPNGGRAYVTQQRLHINVRGRGANGRGGVRGGTDRHISVADFDQNTTQATGTEKNHGQNQDTGSGGDRSGRNGGRFGRGAYQRY